MQGPPLDLLPGQAVGDYRLVRELGRGSAGVVYLAEHPATGLDVAIKVVHRHLVEDVVLARRMAREARFANQLAVDTVVNVFDFSTDDPIGAYLVMEHLQGETLLELINLRVPHPGESLQILSQVGDALGEAHRRQIVHGALKPSNVFRTGLGLVKVLPFGVSTGPRAGDEAPVDRAIAFFGSPDLRAPEQARGAPPDPRMDVYSLGALAYLLATGQLPFSAPNAMALERAHAEVVPPAPHRVNPKVSRAWSAAIMRALEKAPERRFESGSELARAFREAPAVGEPMGTTTASFVLSAPLATPQPIAGGLADDFVITPKAPPPAARVEKTAPALRVTVSDERGQSLGEFDCSSVTRAGLLVCTPGPLPPLLSRLRLTFAALSALGCDAQVVHHVTVEQAAQWKMAPGYGVQFGTLSAEQRARLEGAQQGVSPSAVAERPDDPAAAEILQRFSAERAADGYAMLAISKAAPFEAIRDRVREARRVLEGLQERTLSPAQQQAFEEARLRLDELGQTLGEASRRLEYDAARGNFEGVARCLNAGISAAEVEAVRVRFLQTNPDLAGQSRGSLIAGQTLEARQQMPLALDAYAQVLKADPLNLAAHQRYWAVKRQLEQS